VKDPPAAGSGNEQALKMEVVKESGGVAVFCAVPVQRHPQLKTTSLNPLMICVDASIQSIVQVIVDDIFMLQKVWDIEL
jgi:hypothetical protein